MAAAGGLESRMPPVGRIQHAWEIHLRWRHPLLRVSHSKEPLAALSHSAGWNRHWPSHEESLRDELNRFWNMELFLEGLRIHESEIGEDSEIAGWIWEFAGQKIELNRSECVIYSEDIDSEFQRSGGLLAHIHLNGAQEDRRS